MQSKAEVHGHPLHQMLLLSSLALLALAVIFDLITSLAGNPLWTEMAFYMIGAGLITGAIALIDGLVHYLAIPADTRAKSIAALHLLGNVFVLALFAGSWLLRRDHPDNPVFLACLFSYMGAGLSLMTGWLAENSWTGSLWAWMKAHT